MDSDMLYITEFQDQASNNLMSYFCPRKPWTSEGQAINLKSKFPCILGETPQNSLGLKDEEEKRKDFLPHPPPLTNYLHFIGGRGALNFVDRFVRDKYIQL